MSRSWLSGLCAAIGALAVYLLFWPVAIDPEAWTPPEPPDLIGVYAPNDMLAETERLQAGPVPESVAIDANGNVYTGLLDGRIVRISSDRAPEIVAETPGQKLGMTFDASGDMTVCNIQGSILSVSVDGITRELVREVDGIPLRMTNDLDIGPDGTIYFSESSTETSDTMADLLEHRGNGRLLAFHPETGETEVLLSGLYYANGVAVSANGSFVLVVETTEYRVRRLWLSGPRAGENEVLIENLPGFPDGLSRDDEDLFWVALMTPRNGFVDWALERPWIRRVAARLPLSLFAGAAPRYGFVLAFDVDGNVVHNLQDPSGEAFAGISCVVREGDFLYFGSLLEDDVGVLRFP